VQIWIDVAQLALIALGGAWALYNSLEPGENVDSEAAFLVDAPLRMMAMRISVRGWQGRWGRRSYWWGAFFYIIPEGGGISPAVPGTLESMGES
jgi:hypothetical protein